MIFWFQMIPHLQSIKVIPKFLLENSCTASLSSKTSGYSFLRDKIDYPEIRDNQSLSVAGARAGLSGARSGLFMEQIRIVKEMRNADVQRGRTGIAVRPRWMCWENVPGAFSSGSPKGEDFRVVLEEIVRVKNDPVYVPGPHPWAWQPAGRIVLGTGFSLAWRVFDAQYWPRTPQRRRRIFLIADFAGRSAPQILFKQDSLPGYPAQSDGT